MASPYPRKEQKESAIPLGAYVELYFREAIGDLASVAGGVSYIGPYGIRVETENGTDVYVAHQNVLGATTSSGEIAGRERAAGRSVRSVPLSSNCARRPAVG